MNRHGQSPSRTLVYFTDTFPYGLGQSWKYNDLNVFRLYFDKVYVLPFGYGATSSPVGRVPEGVEVLEPLCRDGEALFARQGLLRELWSAVRDPVFYRELPNSLSATMLRDLWAVLRFRKRGQQIAMRIDKRLSELNLDATAVFFFFWGLGCAEGIPWLKGRVRKMLVGFHGSDLYEERRNGQRFPFRDLVLERVALAAPCSLQGAQHLSRRYPKYASKVCHRYLGAEDCGLGPWESSKEFRIVSCARVDPVKRLPLLIDALALCRAPIQWTHLGGGAGLERLKSMALEKLPANIGTDFRGSISAPDVRKVLAEESFDLFVNVSEYEGLPISIIEAMSAGLPVLATDVGGVSEAVEAAFGSLISKEAAATDIAAEIGKYIALPRESHGELRRLAREKYVQRFKAPEVIVDFAERYVV